MQPPTFAIVPTTRELAALQRDIHFIPSPVTAPTFLSPTQVEAFNRIGYLFPIPVFTPDEILGHRQYFDALLERTLATGGDAYSISSAHLHHGRVYDLLTDSRLTTLAADLLGENVVAWGAHYFCKLPGDEKSVAWHQDASYWPLTPSRTITVWLAIDDADPENACMQYLPGSHRDGLLAWRESELTEGNVLNQTVTDLARFGSPVDVALRAGEVAVHSDQLLHGSGPNRSTRRRCGLTLRYCAAEVRAHLGWNAKGLVVRGCDPAQHWANPARPATD